jgi:hypothetical protein
MADSRGYFKVTNNLPDHPKVVEAGGDAGWLHVCAMAYCSGNFTDGMVPIKLVPRLSDRENPKQLASKLLDVGLWHASGHECKRCAQPDDKHYIIHDYLDHQTSAERARETSLKRAAAGRRGGEAKAASSKLLGAGYDGASSKRVAEEEQEEHGKKTSSSSSRTPSAAAKETKGTRIPDDFTVTDAMKKWAAENVPRISWPRETTKFVNHWKSKAGRDATKVKWDLAWQNWLLNADDHLGPAPGPRQGHQQGSLPFQNPEDTSGYDGEI